MSSQHDLAKHVAGCQPFMRLCRIGEGVSSSDRDLKPRSLDGSSQAIELVNARNGVVGDDVHFGPLLWLRVYSVWIGEPATGSQRIEASLQSLATSQP